MEGSDGRFSRVAAHVMPKYGDFHDCDKDFKN
jgi:hypothetical protein